MFLLLLAGCQKNDTARISSPPPSINEINTDAVNNISADSAEIHYTSIKAADSLSIIETGVCYGTKPHPDITQLAAVKKSAGGSFSISLSGLQSNTVYYTRAFVRKQAGYTYGNELIFTSALQPVKIGGYFNGAIRTLSADAAGNLYAGGDFVATGNGTYWYYVAKWNGSSWNQMTGLKSTGPIQTIYTDRNGTIYTGVSYTHFVDYSVAKYDGQAWSTVGVYNNGNFFITRVCADGAGNVYAIGSNYNAAGKYYVAKWGPGGYQELGSFNQLLTTIATDTAGNLYAGGLNSHGYNGTFGNFYISKWQGNNYSEIGFFNDATMSICFDPSGKLVAGGAFATDANGNTLSPGPSYNALGKYYIAKWNGSSWSATADMGIYKIYGNSPLEICTDKAGNIYAIGDFINAKGKYYVAKWDGTAWTELASFSQKIMAICTDPQGNVYVGGMLTDNGKDYYVARCN